MYENVKNGKTCTWRQFAKKKDDVIILPRARQNNIPHLPTCVDTVIAMGFAYRIAEKINGVVAPALSYGYKSKPH